MVDFVVYVVILNIIFEMLQIICPISKLSGFVRSCISVLVIYLMCLKVKNVF